MLRKQGLQTQVVLIVVVALVLLAAVLVAVRSVQEHDTLVQAKREQSLLMADSLRTSTRTLSDVLAAWVGAVGNAENTDIMSLALQRLDEGFAEFTTKNSGIAFELLALPNGVVLSHSNPNYKGKTSAELGLADLPLDKTVRRDLPGYGSVYLTQVALEDLGFFPGLRMDWIIGLDAAPIDHQLQRGVVSSLLIAFGALGLVSAAALYSVRRTLVKPLRAVQAGAQTFGAGQLDHVIEVKGSPELRDLAFSLNHMAADLKRSREESEQLYRDTEQRIQDRTRDLAMSAEIGRIATSLRDVDTLLRESVAQIRRRFEAIYHAQIFLLDDLGENAVLVASTGEAGRRLIDSGHKLAVGSDSVIGRVTARKQVSIASDTRRLDIPWQPNPLLPQTRSEMALPLMIEGRVIGALDLQSTTPDAFTDDMVRVLEVLADQLAIAIENARLLEESDRRLRDIDDLNRQLTRSAWEELIANERAQSPRGYLYNQMRMVPLRDGETPDVRQRRSEMPIQLRGEIIGTLETTTPDTGELPQDDRLLVQAVAERVALAIENARLFEQTQRALAETERLYETARTVSSGSELEAIYQLIAEQLSAIPQVDDIDILLSGPDPSLVQYLEEVFSWNRRDAEPHPATRERLPMSPLTELGDDMLPVSAPAVVSDAMRELPRDHPLLARFADRGVCSAVLAPLSAAGHWFGLLVCSSLQPGGFQPGHVTFASALADQLAIAIENRRLFEEAQSEARRARALAGAGQLASQIGGDYETGLHNLFQAVAGPGNYNRWWFGLLSDDRTVLRQVVASGIDVPDMIRVSHDEHTLAEAARIGEIVLVNDPRDHPAVGAEEQERVQAWGKHIAMPVKIGTQLVGVMLVGRRLEEQNLDERDIQLVATLASQIAVATQNQRLFAEVENQRQNLQMIVDTMPTGILVMDRSGSVLLSNRRLIELLGPDMRPDTQGPPSPYPVVRATTRDPYPQSEWPLNYVFLTGTNSAADDMMILHPEGSEIQVLARAVPIRDYEGHITAAVGAFQDITELQQLERALQDSLRETTLLYEASRSIARASDMRELLRAILEQVDLLEPDRAYIVLKKEDSGAPTLVASRPPGLDAEHDLSILAPAFDQEALIIERAAAPDDLADSLDQLDLKMLCSFPLDVHGRINGWIAVGFAAAPVFSGEDRRFMITLADQAAVALENSRLYQQAQRRARQLATSAEISRAVTSILQLDRLLPQIVNLIRDSFEYDHAQVFLLNEDGTEARLVASTGEAGKKLLQLGHSLRVGSKSVIGQVTANGQPQIALDTADARVVHLPNPLLPDTRSELALPLIARGQILGALDVQSNLPAAFTDEDARTLALLADMVATAIDNARLFELSEQRAEEMTLLFKVTTAATVSPDLEQSLERAVATLRDNMGVTSASVYLPDETGRYMVKGADTGVAGQETEHSTISIDRGLIGWVARHEEAVLIDDISRDPRRLSAAESSRSIIAVPLQTGGVLIGVLAVETDRPRAFDEHDLRLMQTLSGSLAAIVQNSRLLREVQDANVRLREVDRLKTNFLAAMSHELRTPLNSIIGFSRVILKGIDGPLSESQEQDITTIYDSGKHLLGLVNDILDQAKIEAGKMELSFAYFKVQDVIHGVMSSAVGLTRDKPIRLHTEIADGLPDAYGDEFRTRQVLLNLVSNAAKFTDEGSVTLSAFLTTEDDQLYIQVSVTDTGIGIAEKDMPLLFQAFQQLDDSLTRKVGGTGMGLPLAKSLTELQHGRIWLESQPGAGSTFSITIPIAPPPGDESHTGSTAEQADLGTEAQADPGAGEHESRPRRPIVLVIEDNVEVISLYRRYLSRAGYEVLGVIHPEEVTNLIVKHSPNLILLDVNMHDQAGWDVLANLKGNELSASIPVVVCSLNTDSERGLEMGASDYIVKPFGEDQLLGCLQARLNSVQERS
jgi:GAF domain-containing protein/ActR/RegA family two-component response regulator/HAMP domain-containing protein